MNLRLTFPKAIFLALPLVLLAPGGALAQGKSLANPAAASGSGRQAIINKLERIRLDSVHYDGVPLSEVVNMLREQAAKHDREGNGINFLINPNMAPSAVELPGPFIGPNGTPAAAPPQELVDVGSITIKINPPLKDLRLVDVLDAVVKVADHPINYSIEDYGVVFSQRGTVPAPSEPVAFSFPGGNPREFLEAVEQQYNVDWKSVAEIPKEMADVRIPHLRIQPEPAWAPPRPAGDKVDPLAALVSLYNQLGDQKPELGRLLVKGDLAKPSVVMFVSDKATADTQLKLKVKAFSIWGINDADRAKLAEDINRAKDEAMSYALNTHGSAGLHNLQGTFAIHNDTSLLVATGTEPFVDMVESIVTACQANSRDRNPAAPTPPPSRK
jgi:hypothetical protein